MKRRNVITLAGAVAAGGILAGVVIYPGASGLVDTYFAQEAAQSQADSNKAEEDLGLNAFRAVQEEIDGESDFSMISTVDTLESDRDDVPDFSYANVADVAEAVMPSIVAITNKSVQEVRSYFYGQTYTRESESAGSGIIVGSNETELLVCTNNHVVEDASELTVTFIDEESYAAQVKGTDARNDLAVVAVNLEDISKDTMDAIKIARIGDADTMRVGEQVVAIGNALGYGQSVTTGIISAKDRSITIANESNGFGYGSEDATTYDNLIQTDAAINPGNSGGALLNMNGEVIGINSAKASSNGVEGMGYAISVTRAMPILDDLMTRKTRVKLDEEDMGYIGINGQRVSSEATTFYGVPQGIYLTLIKEDGPAGKAGLQEGDILSKFDGEQLTSMQDLQHILQYYEAGETVEVTVYRPAQDQKGYEEQTFEITLGDRAELQ